MTNLQLLIAKAQEELNSTGLPFMDGREKGEVSFGVPAHIVDYGWLQGTDGEFVCFIVGENKEEFYFGSSVVSEKMKKMEEIFTKEEIDALLGVGIQVEFTQKKSRNNRRYTDVKFF